LYITKKGALDSQPQMIKFTSCLPMVGGSLRLLPPPGLSFEASCLRNSTSTLYSAAGYFLYIKDKKCIIYSLSRYRDNDCVFFSSLPIALKNYRHDYWPLNCKQCSQTGRRVTVFHWPAKIWYPCVAWTNFIDRPKNQ
jgi:hypothetical protein